MLFQTLRSLQYLDYNVLQSSERNLSWAHSIDIMLITLDMLYENSSEEDFWTTGVITRSLQLWQEEKN